MVSLRKERGYLVSEGMESEQHSECLNSRQREVNSDRKESTILSQINQEKNREREVNCENELLVVFQIYVKRKRKNSGESAAYICTL